MVQLVHSVYSVITSAFAAASPQMRRSLKIFATPPRAAGGGELRLGRRREPFRAVELRDGEKPALLRAYLHRWRFEVAAFFAGVGAEASDAELLRIAPGYPVFRIAPS